MKTLVLQLMHFAQSLNFEWVRNLLRNGRHTVLVHTFLQKGSHFIFCVAHSLPIIKNTCLSSQQIIHILTLTHNDSFLYQKLSILPSYLKRSSLRFIVCRLKSWANPPIKVAICGLCFQCCTVLIPSYRWMVVISFCVPHMSPILEHLLLGQQIIHISESSKLVKSSHHHDYINSSVQCKAQESQILS